MALLNGILKTGRARGLRGGLSPALILLLAAFQPHATAPRPDLGVVTLRNGQTCIALRNPGAPVNAEVRLISHRAVRPGVLGPKQPSCAGPSSDPALTFYSVLFPAPPASDDLPAIGVLNYRGRIHNSRDTLSADLARTGHPWFFRSCLSAEGIHFTAWSGKPLTGKREWHQYQYLGYDTTPTCTDAETISDH